MLAPFAGPFIDEIRMPPTAYDPYQLSAAAVQPPPASLGRALLRIGPGLILAGSIVGTGELIATTNLGAKVGFAFLWLVLLSCFIKVFVQVELGRHAIASGETTLTSFHRLPGPGFLFTWWWFVMMLATQAQLAAMVGGVGQALHMAAFGEDTSFAERLHLSGRPELPWAALTALGTAGLLALGSYRVVERGSTFLVVLFTIMTVACVALLPGTGHSFGWGEIASGLSFEIPAGAIGAALAMFGITGVGASELIAYPYWCIEKGYARNVGPASSDGGWLERARGWLRVMQLDAWVCMLVYTVATLAFYVLGAAVLHKSTGGEGLPREVDRVFRKLAGMYEAVLGKEASVWFIVIGAFAVLYSTLFSATAANSRTLVDFLRVNRLIRLESAADRKHWVRLFCIAFPLLGLSIFIWFPDPVQLILLGGFAQALTLPMIATAALYLRYRRTDRRLTAGFIWDLFLWLSMLAFIVTAGYGVWDFLQKQF
jgi:Mn2+/Fe2+ NRAMP family transporter